MEQRTKVLLDIFEPISQDCQTWRDDLQLALTLNPDLEKVEKAMDEWGKQQSIAFARWIGENGYAYIGDNWYHMDDEDGDNKLSEEELYNLFIKDTE